MQLVHDKSFHSIAIFPDGTRLELGPDLEQELRRMAVGETTDRGAIRLNTALLESLQTPHDLYQALCDYNRKLMNHYRRRVRGLEKLCGKQG